MTTCCECGSTTNPLWYSNDEWADVPVCMECVKTRHWNNIKSLIKVDTLFCLLLLTITIGFGEHGLIGSIIVVTLLWGMITFFVFSPYPLYGENRRRYKEWKERTQRKEEEEEINELAKHR